MSGRWVDLREDMGELRQLPEATPPPSPPVRPRTSSAAPLSVGIGRVYERFLEMPTVFVLGVTWLAGVALLGSCALVLYLAVSALISGWW
jgi:hypothetical protein